MERFTLLAPALLLAGFMFAAFFVYCGLHAIGRAPTVRAVKHNQLFGPFVAGFLVWVIGPLERQLVGRVSPNVITAFSLLLCAATGVSVALGHLGAAVWLYSFAGILDVLDGRIARLSGKQTAAGALFDSVSDRWGELIVFGGYAWYLRTSPWLLAVMAALAGSMMVSYTRARAEGLGIQLSGGLMQRAERVVLVASGTLVAAWYAVDPATSNIVIHIVGAVLALCAVTSTATAINRWVVAHRELSKRASEPIVIEAPEPVVAATPRLAKVPVLR